MLSSHIPSSPFNSATPSYQVFLRHILFLKFALSISQDNLYEMKLPVIFIFCYSHQNKKKCQTYNVVDTYKDTRGREVGRVCKGTAREGVF